MVDIVGKVLTPALLAGLLVLIVVGVVHPMGPVGEILSSLSELEIYGLIESHGPLGYTAL